MSPENRKQNLAEEWLLSEAAEREAQDLIGLGHFRAAVARAYYAAFYAARAALLTREVEPTTHAGVRGQFHRVFIHGGLVARAVGRALSHLQKEREEADYSRAASFGQADAEEAVAAAQELRQAVKALLIAEDWMGA